MGWLRKRRISQLSRMAQKLLDSGNPDAAVRLFRQALALDPADPLSHVHLALALVEAGELDEARAAARSGIELAPRSPAVRLFAGRAFYDAADFPAARDAFGAALALSPRNDLAFAWRVLAEWAAGDSEAWRRLDPRDLPDSTPFLVRWLEQVERQLHSPAAATAEPPLRRSPAFRPCRDRPGLPFKRTRSRPCA